MSANRACLERPYNFARGAGMGPGTAAFCFQAGSQLCQNHSLDTQAPCEIHWNLAYWTHDQHGLPTQTNTIALLLTKTSTKPVLEMKKVSTQAP